MAASPKILLENINHPGKSTPGDAAMYGAMRAAVLTVLPTSAPGMTTAQLEDAVLVHLPEDLYPKGAKAGWWTKAVQLDLEAKDVIRREGQPLRLHKV